MPNCAGQTTRRVDECSACGGFCGDQELYLADMELSRAGQPAIVMVRSWRCLIRHAIKQHELSQEPRPVARCTECGAVNSAMADGAFCTVRMGEDEKTLAAVFCTGTMRARWEGL